jgi:hypothetical protein
MTHLVQINNLVREATPEEAVAIDASQAAAAAAEAATQAAAAAKASARAKLAALGLTEDEVNALIGGM